ncbi:MAG: hypothetical protein FLDDKLPJ_02420 [Phycisphaerae bacterium]|nr:hypothetical protein [Phycisphaerae bacterium]
MKPNVTFRLLVWSAVLSLGAVVSAQEPDFKFTKVVDINGTPDANFTEIQDAIDAITVGSGEYWTVLIYPGVYTINGSTAALIELGVNEERISLRGVDRQSVIIDVTTAGSGIKITSGDETLRECRISNLTIKTSNGHGIEIVKGDTPVPKDIRIEGVTIEAEGSSKNGIDGSAAEQVRVFDARVSATGSTGIGVEAGSSWTIDSTSAEATGSGGVAFAIPGETSTVTLTGCRGTGKSIGLSATGVAGLDVRNCVFQGESKAVFLQSGPSGVLIRDCQLLASAPDGAGSANMAFLLDNIPAAENVILRNCKLAAVNKDNSAYGVWHELGALRVEDCEITVRKLGDTMGEAVGILASSKDAETVVIGGSVVTTAAAEKETEVWDLLQDPDQGDGLAVSGTRFSKWKGPIFSSERPRPVTQRTVTVAAADDDGILVETALNPGEQSLTEGFSQPDEYRCLSIKSTAAGDTTGVVHLIGTNWANDAVTEAITLNGAAEVKGRKPFKTVTKIILPGYHTPGEKVRIGTTDRLGLYSPIAAAANVLQQGRKASAASSYTLETVGSVDATYAWVEIASPAVTSNDSFEWAILASQ